MLSNRALVAANKGIGKAAAQILAQNGLKTIVAARDGTSHTLWNAA